MTAVLPAPTRGADATDITDAETTELTELTDAQLLKRHSAGCGGSYACLVARHERLLRWTLHRLGIDPEDHADILQEALLKVHRQAASFRGEGCAGAWLRTIVTNTALTHLRDSARRHEEVDSCTDGIHDRLQWTPDTRVVDAGRSVQRMVIRDAVSRLHPGLRDTVLLSDLLGLSMQDVSVRTGVPVGTVKSRLSRARRQLRGYLTDAGLVPTVLRRTS